MKFSLFVSIVVVILTASIPAFADRGQLRVSVPSPEFANDFGSYSLDFYDGSLYLSNGDGLFVLNESGSTPKLDRVASGFRTVFSDSRGIDGGMAISGDGTVLVPVGFNGGASYANLSEATITPKVAPDIADAPAPDGSSEDNIFAVAGSNGGNFYASGQITRSASPGEVYAYNPSTDSSSLVATLSGQSSGGIAVRSDGKIIGATFDFNDFGSADDDRSNFFLIDPTDGMVTSLGTVQATGNSSIVVDDDNTVYFASSTGIAALTSSSESQNIVGDVTQNPFESPDLLVQGLTIDRANDRLFFLQQNDLGNYELRDFIVPEPGVGFMLASGLMFLVRFKRQA
jgi:hypothetical protein